MTFNQDASAKNDGTQGFQLQIVEGDQILGGMEMAFRSMVGERRIRAVGDQMVVATASKEGRRFRWGRSSNRGWQL